MAISYVSSNRVQAIDHPSASLAVTMPSGYAAGDALLVCIATTLGADASEPIVPPTGWLLVGEQNMVTSIKLRVWYKFATGGEGATQTFTVPEVGGDYVYSAAAYRGSAANSYVVVANASTSPGTSWTSATYSAAVAETAVSFWWTSFSSVDAGSTQRSIGSDNPVLIDRVTGPGTTSGSTVTLISSANSVTITVGLRPLNSAPYAPSLVNMASGEAVDLAVVNRAYHAFSDPDSDLDRPEGQSGFDIRYRVVGAPSWTTVTQAGNTDQFYDFPASTFTANNYERQVRTYDLAVLDGPWSSSGFFTAANAPAAPSITDPTVDEVMTSTTFDVDWTVTTQTAYQIRKVADNAGSPDTTTVYYDSGAVAAPATRTATVTFPVNNRFEHIQVRVWDGVLWSAWSSVRVEVDYVPPPAPVVTLSVDTALAAIVIDYDTPAPVGAEPTPTYVDIWIDDGGDIGDERKAAGLPIDGSWSFMTPRSSRDYAPHIRVIAYTADGIPSE